jgi:DNA primase
MNATEPKELIREKLDIVEFLKGYLTLQPAGRNFKALCPFHKEKSPSFMVSPDRQTWHCFGCGTGGDVFAFVMKYENVEFGEAIRILADKAGVELRRVNPAEHKYTGLLLDLNALAKEFYKDQLARTPIPRKYLEERGLAEATIAEFELGWAPNDAEALTFFLLNKGFRPEDLIQAGLSFKTERGAQIDRFRGRIMFPIHDHFGKVVGFTGRILPQLDTGNMGKYVNSPETAIFNKSKLLYGFWKTKNAVREAGAAFLVEGQMDFLMSWQAGVTHAIASSGTALTPDHLRTLRRLCDKIVLSFDSDEAGLNAGERAIDLAEANDFEVRVVDLGKYKDPGEMGQADPKGLLAAVEKASPAPEFYFGRYLKGALDLGDRDSLKRLRAVLGKLKRIASPVTQAYWMQELARRTHLDLKTLREEADRLGPDPSEEGVSRREPEELRIPERSFGRWELLSQRVLAALHAKNRLADLGEHTGYLASGYADMLSLLEKDVRRADDPATDELLNLVLLRAEDIEEAEIANLKEQLFREYLKERRRELTDALRRAEAAGDAAAEAAVLEEFRKLPRQ